jgi:hypothetical protein
MPKRESENVIVMQSSAARSRAPYYDEFHFWLASACLNLGEKAQARTQLALAVDTSRRPRMRGLYSSRLAQLASSRARLN